MEPVRRPLPVSDAYALSSFQQAVISTCGTFFYVANFFFWKSFMQNRTNGLSKQKLYQVSNLIVSSIQSALASIMALIVICTKYDDIVRNQHPLINIYTAFAMPYFAYDVWSMYYCFDKPKNQNFLQILPGFLRKNWLMIAHHTVTGTIGTLVILNWRHGVGDVIVAFFYLHELSTPFVSFREILSVLQLKHTKLYSINGLLMIIAFFLCRILIYPFMFTLYSMQEKIDLSQVLFKLPGICTICSSLILLPQIYWFTLIVRGAVKHFFLNPKVSKEKTNNNKLD